MSALYTASYYQPENWVGACFRVSRAHPRGRKSMWECLPFLYPGRPLLQSYRAGHFGFDTFSESYCGQLDEAYLHDPGLKQWVEQELPHLGDATLLCFERQGEPCHRLVLARWLKGKQPTLELGELR